MKNQQQKPSFLTRVRQSVTMKIFTIIVLMLLLLIPIAMVKDVMQEREQQQSFAVSDIHDKWAHAQRITGPVLTVPVRYAREVEYEDEVKIVKSIKNWHILPAELSIDGELSPKILQRGIFEAVVYRSQVAVSGRFDIMDLPVTEGLDKILWEDAFMTIGLSDLRGLKEQPIISWADGTLDVAAGSSISSLISTGITATGEDMVSQERERIPFSFDLSLLGSRDMTVVPVGKETKVSMKSTWEAPSFMGNFLPDSRDITSDGFTAEWSVLELNRNYPQTWMGNQQGSAMTQSAFGVTLLQPVNDYHKSMRTARYAVMTITLTFLVFFLVEILTRQRIHPLQYALIGLALCLFFILLVSLAEHSNFNLAYGVSAISTVLMIVLYGHAILRQRMTTMVLLLSLALVYGYIFVTLQLEDYALLMGSIGLMLILAITMYFTRRIDWYALRLSPSVEDNSVAATDPQSD